MLRLYHNPRCSKSRAALALLQESGREFEVVRYLDTPPGAAALGQLLRKLGLPAAALLRRNEPEFEALGLTPDAEIDDCQALALLLEQPRLLQRPILETADRAVIGRPPERIREML